MRVRNEFQNSVSWSSASLSRLSDHPHLGRKLLPPRAETRALCRAIEHHKGRESISASISVPSNVYRHGVFLEQGCVGFRVIWVWFF